MNKVKKFLFLTLSVALMGGVIGGITWLLLFAMNLGIDALWYLIPQYIGIPFYPVIVCVIGGLFIGLFEMKFGKYPEELNQIMGEIKEGKKLPYNNLHIIGIAALLPLIFGGCLGPEAGLTGVIVGLCFWFSDRFKFLFGEINEIAEIGMSAAMSVIFGSPLFGFVNQVEDERTGTKIPKNAKILMYFIAILSGFGAFLALESIFGGMAGLGHFPSIENVGFSEWIAAVPLALIGALGGILYFIFKRFVKIAAYPLRKKLVLRAMICGLILGLIGIVLPFTMFSGEHQMTEIMNVWQDMGFFLLLITGIMKLFIGNVCIEMGWRGGNIFPVIFAGVSLGYAFATFIPIDPVFCVAVVTAALASAIMRKPLAVILLLLICFPINGIIPMSIGAVIGGAIPIPKFLGKVLPE
ncbi:MAG: chloride channel protein [Eubacteriaceae bacterium]